MESLEKTTVSNWVSSQRTLQLGVLVAVCLVILFVSALRDPVDYDSWWHLKMGQDLIEQGMSPYVDHYSIAFRGETVSGPPVAFQVFYYALNHWLGERGAQVAFKVLAYASLLALFLFWMHQVKTSLPFQFLVLCTLLTVIQFRMQVRPELISYSLTLLSFILYHRAQARISWHTMWPVALLLIVWVNYHTPLFGYVIFFGLFVDAALRQFRASASAREWAGWLGWGLLLVMIGFFNVQGNHFLIGTFTFAPEWAQEIREYFPPVQYLGFLAPYLWLLIAACTLALSLYRKQIGYVIILVVFLYGGLTMSRMVVPAMIVCLAILADVAQPRPHHHDQEPSKHGLNKGVVTLLFLVGSIALALSVHRARVFLDENVTTAENVPRATVDYLQATDASGNIFNTYALGGYLLYRLSPQLRVYIDGRTNILYPIEHFLRYRSARLTAGSFLEEVNSHDIELALLPLNRSTLLIMQEAGFRLDFAEAQYGLFRRENGQYGRIGDLATQPYCSALIIDLPFLEELSNFLQTNPTFSYLQALVALLGNYLSESGGAEFLASVDAGQLVTDESRRLYASLALRHGLHQQAINVLNALDTPEPRDWMAEQLILVSAGFPGEAERRLRYHLDSFTAWRNVHQRDIELLLWLVEMPLADAQPPLLQDEAIMELSEYVGESAHPSEFTVDQRSLCQEEAMFHAP